LAGSARLDDLAGQNHARVYRPVRPVRTLRIG
jgi:hypothetical protein